MIVRAVRIFQVAEALSKVREPQLAVYHFHIIIYYKIYQIHVSRVNFNKHYHEMKFKQTIYL